VSARTRIAFGAGSTRLRDAVHLELGLTVTVCSPARSTLPELPYPEDVPAVTPCSAAEIPPRMARASALPKGTLLRWASFPTGRKTEIKVDVNYRTSARHDPPCRSFNETFASAAQALSKRRVHRQSCGLPQGRASLRRSCTHSLSCFCSRWTARMPPRSRG
jgi:hypothetical protein